MLWWQFFTRMRAAVSDLRVSVEQIIAEDDKVAAHVSMSGKHTGELMGIPPNEKEVVMRVSDIVRMENGKAVEHLGGRGYVGLRVSGVAGSDSQGQ